LDLLAQNVFSRTFSYCSGLSNQIPRHLKFCQRGTKVLHHSVTMCIVKTPSHEMCMAFSHIRARVIVWSTEGHRQKGFLLGCLFIHIDTLEESLDTIILQNLAIKNIHRSVNSTFPTNFAIQTQFDSPNYFDYSRNDPAIV